jgi:hypothetical protein
MAIEGLRQKVLWPIPKEPQANANNPLEYFATILVKLVFH